MTSQAAGRTALVLALAIVTLGVAMSAKGASSSSLPRGDAHFLQKAAEHGFEELQLAQLARQKAMRDEVRQFADRMVADHTKANEELQALAMSNGVKLPNGPDKKHSKEMRKLEKLSGGDFDRAYMKRMVKDHHDDVEHFEHAAKTRSPNATSEFAARQLPILTQHLEMARATYDVTLAPKRTAERQTGSTRQ
jgi:putative membrane protein